MDKTGTEMHAQLLCFEIYLKMILWKEVGGFHSIMTEVSCVFDWPRKLYQFL
jgi:hypothetical protein